MALLTPAGTVAVTTPSGSKTHLCCQLLKMFVCSVKWKINAVNIHYTIKKFSFLLFLSVLSLTKAALIW